MGLALPLVNVGHGHGLPLGNALFHGVRGVGRKHVRHRGEVELEGLVDLGLLVRDSVKEVGPDRWVGHLLALDALLEALDGVLSPELPPLLQALVQVLLALLLLDHLGRAKRSLEIGVNLAVLEHVEVCLQNVLLKEPLQAPLAEVGDVHEVPNRLEKEGLGGRPPLALEALERLPEVVIPAMADGELEHDLLANFPEHDLLHGNDLVLLQIHEELFDVVRVRPQLLLESDNLVLDVLLVPLVLLDELLLQERLGVVVPLLLGHDHALHALELLGLCANPIWKGVDLGHGVAQDQVLYRDGVVRHELFARGLL